MTEERLAFTRSFLLFGNLALLAWILLAFFAEYFYSQIYGWLLLLFTVATVYLILRRMGCTSCYYCKTCTSGFGRLAGAFFGTGITKKLSVDTRRGIVGFVYFLLVPLPIVLLSLSVFEAFAVQKVLVLIGLMVFIALSVSTWLKKK